MELYKHPAYNCYDFAQFLDRYIATAHHTPMWEWAKKIWDAPIKTVVGNPTGVSAEQCNTACSIILAYKAKWLQLNGTETEIRKVAEIRGSRFNTGKLRMDLIDQLAMEGLAAVLTAGAIKYNAHNWRDGLPYMETIASMLRHIAKFTQGEDIDPETGKSHADHIQCNAMFLSNMTKTRPDMDDRWKPKVLDIRTPAEMWEAKNKPEGKSS